MEYITPAPPTTKKELHITKRCANCSKLYTEEENLSGQVECKYHTGKWEPIPLGSKEGWTCCRFACAQSKGTMLKMYNEDSFERHGGGCKSADRHIEDFLYNDLVKHFPVNESSLEEQRRVKAEKEALLKEHELQQQLEKEQKQLQASTSNMNNKIKLQQQFPNNIIHDVQLSDTLAGIAIQYNCSLSVLKSMNKLNSFNDSGTILHKYLVIPSTDISTNSSNSNNNNNANLNLNNNLSQNQLIRNFIKQCNCNEEEAKFYLSSALFDYQQAFLDWKADLSWNKQNPK